MTEEPSIIDKRWAMRSVKNKKTPGLDNILAELLKYTGGILQSQFCKLILEKCWTHLRPSIWDASLYGPIQDMARASDKCWLNTPTTTTTTTTRMQDTLHHFIKGGEKPLCPNY